MLAGQLADPVGRDGRTVGIGLVVERGERIDEIEVVGLDRFDEMPGLVAICHHLREFGFVEGRIVKGHRAGIDRLAALAGHTGHHGAGVHPAREEGAQRHVGNHAQAHRLAQDVR
jgi:hypothetical protein